MIAIVLMGCGAGAATDENTAGQASTAAGEVTTIRIGATPIPHAEILEYVKDNLVATQGLNIEIVEFSDYVQPNIALNEGQINANFFQHVPYIADFASEQGLDLAAVADVHIEPLGVYSSNVESLDAVEEGAVVAIPNDATNGGRALQLLAANGLITLADGVGTAATVRDITANPKQLQIEELEAAQLPRALQDSTLTVINTNYALEADLQPNEDALALEAGENNPYANVLAVRSDRTNDAAIQKLSQLIQSSEVKQFIEEKYQGAVVPAF